MAKHKQQKNRKKGKKEVAPAMISSPIDGDPETHFSPVKESADAPEAHSPTEDFGFYCRNYGDFHTVPSTHGFFSITKSCADKREVLSQVRETIMVNPKERFLLLVQPYALTLTELLAQWPISERKAQRYGSVTFYPSDMAKAVIQGIVTAVLNLRESHSYLLNTENLVLQFEDYSPYSRYVGHGTRNYDLLQDIKKAGYDVAPKVYVHLVHTMEAEKKTDDIDALHILIFEVILQVNETNPLLPTNWQHFHSLFYQTPLDYELISCHSCMLSTRKVLGFFRALNDLYYKSTSRLCYKLHNILRNRLQIIKADWLSTVDGDTVLVKIRDNRKQNPYIWRHVSSLISYFRNVVEHAEEVAKTLSIKDEGRDYCDQRYLEYRLDVLFPDLLTELHGILLSAGYVYL